MALERTIQSWVRGGGWTPQNVDADFSGGESPSVRQSPSKSASRGEPSRSDWAQLLEQASDLNDELCKEKAELQREVVVLREKKLRRSFPSSRDGDGQGRRNSLRARGAEVLPRVMSHVRRALHDVECKELSAEGLSVAVEEAIARVLTAAATTSRSDSNLVASNEETAALIQEKVQLKEESLLNQDRIFELEMAREKLLGSTQANGVFSFINNALQGTLADSASSTMPARDVEANVAAERLVESSAAVVDGEYEVVGRKGAILRESEDLESEKVATLPPGSRVRVLEVGSGDGRRARVCTVAISPGGEALGSGAADQAGLAEGISVDLAAGGPIGWLSVTTKDGKALLRPVVAHEAMDTPGADVATLQGPEASPVEGEVGTVAGSSTNACVGGGEAGETDMVATSTIDAAGEEMPATCVEAGKSATAASSTVTVSTDAWLSLRNERNLREQQIKELEKQVHSAQRELEHLAEVRAQLRDKRMVALDMRRRGNELHEAALMAAEELRGLRVEGLDGFIVDAAADATADANVTTEDRAALSCPEHDVRSAEEVAENAPGAADSTELQSAASSPRKGEDSSPQKDEEAEARQRALEWRRLLSERETTAQEYSKVLQRIEELEGALEDRRIELQAAEKRRERERRSLLTALRELNWNPGKSGVEEEKESKARETKEASASSNAAQTLSPQATTSAWYLQRISELEEQADSLRAKLEDVQAREAVLNQHAVVRMSALRYAASASGNSVEAVLSAIDREHEDAKRRKRGDVGGLSEMLEDLFVENFALRGEALVRMGGTGSAARASQPPKRGNAYVSGAGTATSVDLSGFVRDPDDMASDDSMEESDGNIAFGPRANLGAAASGTAASGTAASGTAASATAALAAVEAPPLTPRNSEYWPDSPRSLPSPRLHMLSAEVASLSFHDISIAE